MSVEWQTAFAAAMTLIVLGSLLAASLGLDGGPRRVEEKTPWPCKDKYAEADIESWVQQHLGSVRGGNAQPHMLLMMGGSGSGKGTFLERWRSIVDLPEERSLKQFVMHGLDEYLEYIPEYRMSIEDKTSVFKDAADACYPGAAIPAAKLATEKLTRGRINLIYEETGKNFERIKKRVLPPFVEAGYRVTVVFVDNDAEKAIERAAGRFQKTGRYAPDDYIRGTFSNSLQSYLALKVMEEVAEAVYCNNRGKSMVCFADGQRPADPLVPDSLLSPGEPTIGAGSLEL